MVQISFEDLQSLRKKLKDRKIVFCSGAFDLTHAGHIIFFEDCKNLGDVLIVSVGGDKLLKKYKGDTRPILNEHIRIKTVDSFKPVDYCFLEPSFDSENPLYGLDAVFNQLRPNIYVINEDASNIEYRKQLCNKHKIELIVLKRHCPKEFGDISTSNLINKVKSLNLF